MASNEPRVGPVLHALSSDEKTWRFVVQILVAPGVKYKVTSTSADVVVGPMETGPDFSEVADSRVVRWTVSAKRKATDRLIEYSVSGGTYSETFANVCVPGKRRLPRMSLFSCNGFSDFKERRKLEEPEKMWRLMRERHTLGCTGGDQDNPSGFHLLIGCGDQVYADDVPAARELDGMERTSLEAMKNRPSPQFEKRALLNYLGLYDVTWSYRDVAYMMARVPAVFTWDDHDIIDGWGSHGPEIQEHVRYQALFTAARQVFVSLQLAGDPTGTGTAPLVYRTPANAGAGPDHFLQSLSYRLEWHWVDILLLDLRTHRTKDQVLSDAQWNDIGSWLEKYAAEAKAAASASKHLLVVSSVPVVYLRYKLADLLLRLTPGVQGIEDDLRDQWEHPAHQGERERLIMNLLTTRQTADAEVTILSGDVHLGSRGRIHSERLDHVREGRESAATINQVTASPIAHTPPGGFKHAIIEGAGTEGRNEVSDGVFSEVLDMDSRDSRLRMRNFATLGFDVPSKKSDRVRMWVEWVAEDEISRRQLVVAP